MPGASADATPTLAAAPWATRSCDTAFASARHRSRCALVNPRRNRSADVGPACRRCDEQRSQIGCLVADATMTGTQATGRDHVNADPEQCFQLLGQSDLVEQRCLPVDVHEQIDVARWPSLSAGDRSEHEMRGARRAAARIASRRYLNASIVGIPATVSEAYRRANSRRVVKAIPAPNRSGSDESGASFTPHAHEAGSRAVAAAAHFPRSRDRVGRRRSYSNLADVRQRLDCLRSVAET